MARNCAREARPRRLASLLLSALVTAGCVPGSPPPVAGEALAPGGALVMADWEFPQTFDPLRSPDESSLRVAALVFSPLWGLAPSLQPYPDLVRAVPRPATAGAGGMTLEVRLLPGLAWSDGRPIDSGDLEFTLNAARAAGVPAALRVTSLERRSDTDVVLRYGRADGSYLLLGPALRLLPSHRLAAAAPAALAAFYALPDVGSGPYLPVESVPDDHITFAPNPHYVDGRRGHGPFGHAPYLASLVDRIYPSRDALVAAIQRADNTIAFHFSPADRHDLDGLLESVPIELGTFRQTFLNPNHGLNQATGRAPPWSSPADPALLDALSLALDRVALAAVTGGDPAAGLYPPPLRAFSDSGRRPVERDLAAARHELDTAGWAAGPDGIRARSGRRLEFQLLAACGSSGAALLEPLRRQWADLGAAVSTSCRPPAAFFGPYPTGVNAGGAFDMSLYSFSPPPDPGGWAPLGIGVSAPSRANPAGQNWNRCEDPALDQRLEAGGQALDPGTRVRDFKAAEQGWLAYHCTVPLYFERELRAVGSRVRGFSPNPGLQVDTWNAAGWWMAPG